MRGRDNKDVREKKSSMLGAEKLMPDDGLTQSERFIKAAQELGTDNDPERFAERVRKLARATQSLSDTENLPEHNDSPSGKAGL